MDAVERSDAIEQATMTRVVEIYTGALRKALKSKKAFLQKIADVDSGKIKPPQYYVERGEVDQWRQGFVRELMRQKLLSLGLSENRFELRGFSEPYLTEYYDMDIALDTFPYPGGGTTCDALYMGVPVITLGDGSHGGNFGVSLLRNIGMDFCCAYSFEEYVEKAVQLSSDMDLLNALHLGLRNMMQSSPVMDKKKYMRELESGYQHIFARYLI